jgi:hypothetical protein
MAWLSGWTYRKEIVVDQTDDIGAVNYQMKVLVGESSGATGEEVDCGGHCLSTFNDLRFTSSDGSTLLDYYIRYVSGVSPNQLAVVWVEVPVLDDAADTTIYMYYGSADASADSSLADTFGAGMGDDFEWGADGTHIHTNGGNMDWTPSGDIEIDTAQAWQGTRSAVVTPALGNAIHDKVVAGGYAINTMIRKDDTALFLFLWGNATRAIWYAIEADEDIVYANAANTVVDTTYNATINVWQEYEINNINTTAYTYDLWFEGTKIVTGAQFYTYGGWNGQIFWNPQAAGSLWIDSVLIRKFTANEPTWKSFGAEECLLPHFAYYPHILAH